VREEEWLENAVVVLMVRAASMSAARETGG
jgi:hypothetical protein